MTNTSNFNIQPQYFLQHLEPGHEADYSDLEMVISPNTVHHAPELSLDVGFAEPFSWLRFVKFDFLSQSTSQIQLLTSSPSRFEMRLNAAFHQQQELYKAVPGMDGRTLPQSYLLLSLVNNLDAIGHTDSNQSYEWFKTLPLSDMKRSLGGLPDPIFQALRERVFVAAVRAGDVEIVSAMLALQIEPHEPVMLEPSHATPIYPLEFAVAANDFALARTLIRHMCRGATASRADELLTQVLTENRTLRQLLSGYHWSSLKEWERTHLICFPLAAGASPV